MACIPTCNEPLSFSGADLKENFSVENFVNDCRKRVTLEELRTDLEIYFKFLKTALIEMINDDYSDFVTLSSKLVSDGVKRFLCISGHCYTPIDRWVLMELY